MNERRTMENYNIVRETSSEMRAIARGVLKGNWKKATIVTIVYILLFQGVAGILAYLFPVTLLDDGLGNKVTISYAESLYTFITAGAFTYGYIAFALSLFRRQPAGVGKLFDGFERIIKLLGLTIMITVFTLLWSLLFIIPGIVAGYRYSQAYNILYDHPEYGIFKCISESKRMMNGNKGSLFVLTLSYLGWLILGSLPTVGFSMMVGAQQLANPTLATVILQIVWLLFMAPVIAYVMMGEMAFYELANGNLVRQGIDVTPLANDPIANLANEVQDKPTQVKEEGSINLSKPEEPKGNDDDGVNLSK